MTLYEKGNTDIKKGVIMKKDTKVKSGKKGVKKSCSPNKKYPKGKGYRAVKQGVYWASNYVYRQSSKGTG